MISLIKHFYMSTFCEEESKSAKKHKSLLYMLVCSHNYSSANYYRHVFVMNAEY